LFEFDLGDLLSEYITYKNGKTVSASTYIATDYIRVPQGKIEIPIYFSDAAGMAFYNENKEYISGFGKTTESYGDTVVIDIPINAQYIRLSWLASYKDKVYALYIGNLLNVISKVDANQKDKINPCLYTETSGCRTFRKILCIGDSLTQGTFEYTNEQGEYVYYNDDRYSYPTFLKTISGRDVTNAGTGGLTTKSWWEMHQNDDFSGHDACIIALGRNDYVSGRETTSEERYTYMANIINAVRAANPKIKVFVATMLNYYTGTGADAVNNDMRSIAEVNNCFLVDISKHGKLVQKDYSYSHLTATGYEKVANYYFNYISYIMAEQPKDFMNVQFVGTDYSFDV
jgi:lysophospholipase L1-like esterase